jgi:ArsR family transcriptional regulator
VSHHLRLLREAGLVSVEKRGTWSYYQLEQEALDDLRDAFGVPASV